MSAMLKCQRWIYIQPDRHEPDPRALVGVEHTAGRHTGLHVGSISVGASVEWWGWSSSDGVLVATSALVQRREDMVAVKGE